MPTTTNETRPQGPRHVAIIMDGNGRWAKQRGLPRIEGHRRGADSVRFALDSARKHGVEVLTLYAFSVENWNRPKDEVDALMDLLERFLIEQEKEIFKRKIRLRVVGRYEELPGNIRERLLDLEVRTAHFTGHTLALALNYGSRTEIVDAVKGCMEAFARGDLDPATIDYDALRPFLYTRDLPDPDLVIRTSGEFRLSNFLLLQSAYAEIHVSPVCWPDFRGEHFDAAIADYRARERRYGKTTEQLQPPQATAPA